MGLMVASQLVVQTTRVTCEATHSSVCIQIDTAFDLHVDLPCHKSIKNITLYQTQLVPHPGSINLLILILSYRFHLDIISRIVPRF